MNPVTRAFCFIVLFFPFFAVPVSGQSPKPATSVPVRGARSITRSMRGKELPEPSTPSTDTVVTPAPPKRATNIPLKAKWKSMPATREVSTHKQQIPSQPVFPQPLCVKHMAIMPAWGRRTIILGMQGTPVPKPPIPAQDSMAQLAVRSPSNTMVSQRVSSAEIFGQPENTAGIEGEAAEGVKHKAPTIADTQIQLKEQQRRLDLLLRMFAVDERKFLMDPTGNYKIEDETLKEKRRYEQAELRKTTDELSQLQNQIRKMTQTAAEGQ